MNWVGRWSQPTVTKRSWSMRSRFTALASWCHISPVGNALFCNTLQGGIETFLSRDVKVFGPWIFGWPLRIGGLNIFNYVQNILRDGILTLKSQSLERKKIFSEEWSKMIWLSKWLRPKTMILLSQILVNLSAIYLEGKKNLSIQFASWLRGFCQPQGGAFATPNTHLVKLQFDKDPNVVCFIWWHT